MSVQQGSSKKEPLTSEAAFSVEYILNLNKKEKSRKNPNTCIYEHLDIDIKSAMLTLVNVLESSLANGCLTMLPHLLKVTSLFKTTETSLENVVLCQNLYASVAHEDTICLQYLIHFLFRSTSLCIPSPEKVTKLLGIAKNHLASKQPFIKNATLVGLIDLLQSIGMSNLVIGGLSDELNIFNNSIVDLVAKKDEKDKRFQINYSITFLKLKWSLIGLTIETILPKKHNSELLNCIIEEQYMFLQKAVTYNSVAHFLKVTFLFAIVTLLTIHTFIRFCYVYSELPRCQKYFTRKL